MDDAAANVTEAPLTAAAKVAALFVCPCITAVIGVIADEPAAATPVLINL